MNQHTPVPLKQGRGWGWLQEKVRYEEELSGLAQGGDIAVCGSCRKEAPWLPWEACLEWRLPLRDPKARSGGVPGWRPESQGWVFGMDAEQRSGARSWPGTT